MRLCWCGGFLVRQLYNDAVACMWAIVVIEDACKVVEIGSIREIGME